MKKTVSIIIVHWNTPNSLKTLLTFLKNSKDRQVIVVDNASDHKLNWVRKDFSFTELVENKFNRGYAFACNQGAALGVGEWLLFLNPDVEITPSQINKMVNYAKKNDLDALSVKTSESYSKPLPSLFSLLVEFTPLNKIIPLSIFKQKTLFGGCLLLKAEALKSLGGWDERFFLWFEDSDLTLRLIKNDFKIGWVPLVIKHSGGAAFNKLESQFKQDVFFHSLDIFAKKHFSLFGRFLISALKKRYTKRKVLPDIHKGVSLTVPNLKYELLRTFFQKNKPYLSQFAELTVVSSALTGKNIWDWRKKYPEVRFIPIEKNAGFAPTVNIGFRVSTGKWLGTVNDDVTLTQDWYKDLLNSNDKNIGSFNPLIIQKNGEIESAGINILPKGKAVPILDYHIDIDRAKLASKDSFEVEATNSASVIYSKEALNKVGLFDEKFGSYLEDIDLSLRLKKAGFKNIVSVTSKIIHKGQATSADLGFKKQFYDFRNWIYVILKNWSLEDLVINLPAILLERLKNISGILKKIV